MCVVLLGLLAARAVFLGTVRAGDLSARGSDHSRHAENILAQRGSIVTSDGADLAIDRLAVDITASPNLITDPEGAARRIANALGADPEPIVTQLGRKGKYAVVARNVPPSAANAVRDLDITGLYFSDTYQRFSPAAGRASQVVGLTGDNRAGLSGIEALKDEALTGETGYREEVRDLFGRPISVLQDREPVRGSDIELTIHSRIQAKVESVLTAAREQYGAARGMAIVMRPQDGAILAMATVPGFDPNDREGLTPDAERVRPVTDTFEPGSTFKIVPMVAALEDGKVAPGTTFDLPVKYCAYEYCIKDSHERGPVRLTASQILAQSSNVGTDLIARDVGSDRLGKWIKRFGFGEPTGIHFPGEAVGSVLPTSEWSGTSILNIPIGYGTSVNLVQLARAYAAIANGGKLVTPHLVGRIGDEEVDVPAPRRIMRETTAHQVNTMLKGVVSPDGTGSLAEVKGYSVAGKTGTALKFIPELREYSDTKYTASFVGYAPADNPQLLVAVVMDEPTAGSYYGGEVAAPPFEQIAEFSLQTLKILP